MIRYNINEKDNIKHNRVSNILIKMYKNVKWTTLNSKTKFFSRPGLTENNLIRRLSEYFDKKFLYITSEMNTSISNYI